MLWADDSAANTSRRRIVRLLGPQLIRLFASAATSSSASRMLIPGASIDRATARHHWQSRSRHQACPFCQDGRDQPGLLTMTKAVDEDARIGLHVDRWDRLSVDELAQGSNRISINLGPVERHFIFLNQTAPGMAAMLEGADLKVARDVRAIGTAFMAAFPEYPIVRLRLRPGEAYIAPTENILHDGSSAGVQETNHYLSLRGRFDFLQA